MFPLFQFQFHPLASQFRLLERQIRKPPVQIQSPRNVLLVVERVGGVKKVVQPVVHAKRIALQVTNSHTVRTRLAKVETIINALR